MVWPRCSSRGRISLRGGNPKGNTSEWLLDPELGYAAVRYRVYEKGDAKVGVEYRMEDFRSVDNLMLPFKICGVWGADPNRPVRTETIKVSTYRLNDPENTPDRYHIDWPEGTRIMDTRAGVAFRVEAGGLRYVDDERIGGSPSNNSPGPRPKNQTPVPLHLFPWALTLLPPTKTTRV